jgi:DNA-binding transcriptional ArsR family regulator
MSDPADHLLPFALGPAILLILALGHFEAGVHLDRAFGSLGAHLRRLEDAGYLTAREEFQDRRPVTWYRLAAKGRRALAAHLDWLGRLIKYAGPADTGE